MENEIVKQNISPNEMIREAITNRADLDKLEKLLILQERYEANEARKIFASSFAVAQANIATVIKTKLNPQTHSKYADLGDIIEGTKPIYTKEGFAIIFYEGVTTAAGNIRICADVLHSAGHKETYYYDVPLDGVGIKGNANMTAIHAKASSTSYAQRYLMCMLWNIPRRDDNDAQASIKCINLDQVNFLIDNLLEVNIEITRFLAFMKLDKLENMPTTDYQKAVAAIEAKRLKVKK